MITLSQVKEANGKWFAPENKRFFGDKTYQILHGKETKKPYLVRSTTMWSDMFGDKETIVYRVNYIGDDLKIGSLTDNIHKSLDDVIEWLKEN